MDAAEPPHWIKHQSLHGRRREVTKVIFLPRTSAVELSILAKIKIKSSTRSFNYLILFHPICSMEQFINNKSSNENYSHWHEKLATMYWYVRR